MTIEQLVDKAKTIVENLEYDEDLHEPKSIGLEDARSELYNALIKVDAIRTVQGTNKIYKGNSLQHNKSTILTNLDRLKECLIAIVSKLNGKGEKILTKVEVLQVIQQFNEDENDYYTFIGILSSLDLVTSAGRSRTGGIKSYNKTEENQQIADALIEIEAERDTDSQVKTKEERESVLYPSAAKEISALGFETIIMGGVRRLSGEWNTPDVIGYRINRFKNIGGAEIEIVTVEVKWEISKLAIAESSSHQRLGHKTYLMVHQTFEDVDKTLLNELIGKGIGLICLKDNEHKVYIQASQNNPDKLNIDEFLGQALDTLSVETLKREIAKYFYTDYLRPLLPS